MKRYRTLISLSAIYLCGALYVLFLDRLPFHFFCIFHRLTSIPCPGCGITRAANSLLHGQFLEALYINPAVYPVALLLVGMYVMALAEVIWGKNLFSRFVHFRMHWSVTMLFFLLVLANWAWNISKGL